MFGHPDCDDILRSVRILELFSWGIVDDFSEVQFHALLDCLGVHLFLLRVAVRKVRKVIKQFDRCV